MSLVLDLPQTLPTEPSQLPSIPTQSKLSHKAYNFKIPLKPHSLEPISAGKAKLSKDEYVPKASYLVTPQPNRRKVLTRIRNFYYMKYPSVNVKKYMNPEISTANDNPNLFYTDEEAIEKMAQSRHKQRQRKLERFSHINSKVDSGLHVLPTQPSNEQSPPTSPPPQNKDLNDSKISEPESFRVINLYPSPSRTRVTLPTNPDEPQNKVTGPFLTEQPGQVSPDFLDTAETSPVLGPQRGNLGPLKTLNGPAIKVLTQSLIRANKSSKKSLDGASEFSQDESATMVNGLGHERQKNNIPKQYKVDNNAQFNYYYQKYKDPVIRSKLPQKKKGLSNEVTYQNQYGTVFTRNKLQPIREAATGIRNKGYGYGSPMFGGLNKTFQGLENTSFEERSRRADSLTKRAETLNLTTTENSIDLNDSRLNTSIGGYTIETRNYYNVEDEGKKRRNLKKLPSIYDQYKGIMKALLTDNSPPQSASKRNRSKSRSPSPAREKKY